MLSAGVRPKKKGLKNKALPEAEAPGNAVPDSGHNTPDNLIGGIS